MRSSSAPREYELVNASSTAETEYHEDDGVWNNTVPATPMDRPIYCGRNRLQVLAFVIFIVIIIVVASTQGRRGDNNNDGVPVTTESASNQHVAASTTTPSPTAAQTVASTPPPTASPTAHASTEREQYTCEGDRIQNGVKLKTGHFLCDSYNRYRFGMDDTGSLLYADDKFNMTVTIYQGKKGNYFELLKDGTFTVNNSSDSVVWQEECSDDVSFSAECLPTRHYVYDCPYLHLHSGGTIVLNWINSDDEWKERNILHMYNLPQCHDHFFCYP